MLMGCAGVERAADLRFLERRQLLRRHGERARRSVGESEA
jgi:hypothetical protein